MRVGQALDCRVREFTPFTRYFKNAPSQNVILANDGSFVTVQEVFPLARNMRCNLYRIEKNGRYGVADHRGNIVIQAKYQDLWLVHSEFGGVGRDYLWLSVPNPDPEESDGYRAHYQQLIDIHSGMSLNQEALYGLSLDSFFEEMPEDSDGLFAVQPVAADGPQGYMSVMTGEMAIPAAFYRTQPFHAHRAIVAVTHEHAKALCAGDLPDHVKIGCKHAHLFGPKCDPEETPYDEALCNESQDESRYYGYGVIDSSGHFISRFDYDWISDYSEKLAIFRRVAWYDETEESLGYLDLDGHEILSGLIQAEPYDPQSGRMTAQFMDNATDTPYWARWDADGWMLTLDEEHPESEDNKAHEHVREAFVTPFILKDVDESGVYSKWLDLFLLRRIFTDSNGERHVFMLINDAGDIIWPPDWNHPCAQTDGVVVWPQNTCGFLKRVQFWSNLGQVMPWMVWMPWIQLIASTRAPEALVRKSYKLFNRIKRAQKAYIPPLAAYSGSRRIHYVRVGYGSKINTSPNNPGVYGRESAYGILNIDTGELLFRPGKYKTIYPLFDHLFAFEKDGRMGLMDDAKNIILSPKFERIEYDADHHRLGVTLESHYFESYDDDAQQSWGTIRWYNPETGRRIGNEDELWPLEHEDSNTLLSRTTQDIPVMEPDSDYVVRRLSDNSGHVLRDEVIKRSDPPHPTTDLQEQDHRVIRAMKGRTAVVNIHKQDNGLEMSLPDDFEDMSFDADSLEGEWVSKEPVPDHILQCFDPDITSKTWFEFDDGAEPLVGDSIACVRLGFESYYMTCDDQILSRIQVCTPDYGSRYVNGFAWIKPYGETYFIRADRNGPVEGSPQIYADQVLYRDGVFRFTAHFPSDTDGWKYVEILVNASGQIIWPRDWNKPCHNTNGNIVWPEGSCPKPSGTPQMRPN